MKATLNRGQGGLYYTLDAEDGRELYFGTDWEYPSLARDCGWDMRDVQAQATEGEIHCDHESDGTVTCKRCGLTASAFISAAVDWLDEHDGEEFDVCEELEELFTTPDHGGES